MDVGLGHWFRGVLAWEPDFYTRGRKQMLLKGKHGAMAEQCLPGVVGLMPRGAKRALRYLHHAGIGLVLREFGGMPGVRPAWSFTPPR